MVGYGYGYKVLMVGYGYGYIKKETRFGGKLSVLPALNHKIEKVWYQAVPPLICVLRRAPPC